MVNSNIIQILYNSAKFIGEYASEKGLDIGSGLIWKVAKHHIKKDSFSIKLYTTVEKFVQSKVDSTDYEITAPVCEIICDSLSKVGYISTDAYQKIRNIIQDYSLNIASLDLLNNELMNIIVREDDLRIILWNNDIIHITEMLEAIQYDLLKGGKTGIKHDNDATADISTPNNIIPSFENKVNLTEIPSPIDLIGRSSIIDSIRNLFDKNDIISLRADGGAGKTAIAIELINRIKKEIIRKESTFKHVAWIISTGNLHDDLLSALKNEKEITTYLQLYPTFIVIDNMDTPPNREALHNLYSIVGNTKVLLTSRAEIPGVKQVELSALKEEQALIVFYKYYLHFGYGDIPDLAIIENRFDKYYAENIIKASFFNILLMELIAKAAYKEKRSLAEVWESIEKEPENLSSQASIETEHAHSHLVNGRSEDKEMKVQDQIRRLYRLSALNSEEQEIMEFITIFPVGVCIYKAILEEAGFNIDSITHLEDLGWIKYNASQYGYEVHPLILRSLNLQRDKNENKLDIKKYHRVISALSNTPEQMLGEITILVSNYSKICETICDEIMSQNWLYYDAVDLFIEMGSYYGESPLYGNYYFKPITAQKSVELLKHALKILYSSQNEQDNVKIIDVAIKIIKILKISDDKEGVITLIEEFPRLFERVPESTSSDICMMFDHIGNVLSYYNRNEESISFYQSAVKMGKDIFYKSIPCSAISYSHLAAAFAELGRSELAVANYKKAIEISEKILGEHHFYTASLYRALGLHYYNMEEDKLAEEYINKFNGVEQSYII